MRLDVDQFCREPRRWAGCLSLCAISWLLASSSVVHAHPLSPSLLELREEGSGTYAVRWKTPSTRAPGVEIEPVLPAECREIEERSAQLASNYVEIRV